TTQNPIPAALGPSYDPNVNINAVDNTWDWLTRISGSYVFPYQVQVSSNVLIQSGLAYARTVNVRAPNYRTFDVKAELIGGHRSATQRLGALTAQRNFRLKWGHQVTASVNIFNLFNASFDQDMLPQVASGATFSYSQAVTISRLTEFTLRYKF